MPETETDGAQKLTRRICQRLIADGQAPTLSVSAGAAVYPREGQTYEELFEVADRALYKMKALGGGKTLVLA